jgi:hypothetical protein
VKDETVDRRAPCAASASGAAPSAHGISALRVHVVRGSIEGIGKAEPADDFPRIDAIAVGHYAKVEPQFAELALDNAISSFLPSLKVNETAGTAAPGVITDFTIRRIIQGELGVPFLLPDPRDRSRIIVIAGMGLVGRFGAPELAVLVEQLFWAMARLGRKHLATVLIGSGTGNLETETAVASWMDGAMRAVTNAQTLPPLADLTFVELVPAKAEAIRSALIRYMSMPTHQGLSITVTPSEPIPVPAEFVPPATPRTQTSTHISGDKRGKKYFFGALSDEASYHEDHIELDPDTISHANDELAAKETHDNQRRAGEELFKLVVPKTPLEAFARKDPIVVQCDKHVTQLHWEMMVVPGLLRNSIGDGSEFLGIYPGIARQFQNSFELPPEPPPSFDQVMRVLIVADTDDNRPLPASQDEARVIAALFSRYDETLRASGSKRRVCVESLIGPEEASYDSVLERLLRYPPYNVLHFSGHCEYVEEDPPKSGLLFSKGKKITAYELSRADGVPAFVFSNACSSGEIPEQGSRRAAPSFAEAFFQRGVKNFVCTSWPVASNAARDFAIRLYQELLGIEKHRSSPMHEAVREARKAIWRTPSGARTWGAYQHYGNPWFKLA